MLHTQQCYSSSTTAAIFFFLGGGVLAPVDDVDAEGRVGRVSGGHARLLRLGAMPVVLPPSTTRDQRTKKTTIGGECGDH